MAQELDVLIEKLGSDDPTVSRRAREALEAAGKRAAGAVAGVLQRGDTGARWEAAKALTTIASMEAVPALIIAMRDPEPGVRWLAAEALVAIGDEAVLPVLRALLQHADDACFRQSAHHVLKSLVRPDTSEVVRSLEGRFQSLAMPVAEEAALKRLSE